MDVKDIAVSIIDKLGFHHIDTNRIYFFRSRGSRARFTRARIHGLAKVWNQALQSPPRYLVEVISEAFDDLSTHEKEKVIIHELLHIPGGFSGGFVNHGESISRDRIERLHRKFCIV